MRGCVPSPKPLSSSATLPTSGGTQSARSSSTSSLPTRKQGKLIRGSGGCRKVRWSAEGQGKQGGARVIYFLATDGTIWLLIVYKKAKYDNLPTAFLAELKKGVEDAL